MQASFRIRDFCLIAALFCLASLPLHAQTLARPGWAGSGLTPEPWWRHAVVYRLDNGKLPTLSQLPSLQAFGIDAVLLTPQAMQPAPDIAPVAEPTQQATPTPEPPLSLDDFLFESSRLRIRVLVPLDVTAPDRDVLLALAKSWLYRGAAGFVLIGVDKLPRVADDDLASTTPGPVHLHRSSTLHHLANAEPSLLPDLHKLLATFPGDRILVGETTDDPIAAAMPSLQLRIVSLGASPSTDPQTAARLAAFSSLTSPRPLLSIKAAAMTPVDAALLLAGDQPAILDSSLIPPETLARVFPPLAKITLPDAPKALEPPPPPPPPQNVYGTFKAYVPKANNAAAERKRKADEEIARADAANIAFDTFPVQPLYQAISDTPEGFVAFYRRLIQLHHANPTLHEGTLYELDTAPKQALAWSALHVGSAPVVVVCNTSNADLKLDLSQDLLRLHLGRNMARTLLHTGAAAGIEPVEAITVPAQGVYVGELQRGSSYGR